MKPNFKIAIFVAILIGVLSNTNVSFAEDDDLFIAVGDENLTDAERFTMAKEGLEKALTLAIEKVSQLTADLNNRQFEENSQEFVMRAKFLEDLTLYNTYYTGALESARSLENLESVQVLAQEIKTYRDTVYTPGVEDIVEFVLIFYSEDVLKTANERFEKVSSDIEKLETLGLIEPGLFDEKLESARQMLTAADGLRLQAEQIVIPPIVLETTTTTTTTTTEDLQNTTETIQIIDIATTSQASDGGATMTQASETAEEPVAPKALLEEGLNNVKTVYGLFLEISESVKTTLGIE